MRLLLITGIVLSLGACSSSPKTLGEIADIQGKQYETVAKRWDKGNKLIADGEKDIKAGAKLVKKGKKKIKSGESDVVRGKAMVRDAENKYNELNQ